MSVDGEIPPYLEVHTAVNMDNKWDSVIYFVLAGGFLNSLTCDEQSLIMYWQASKK